MLTREAFFSQEARYSPTLVDSLTTQDIRQRVQRNGSILETMKYLLTISLPRDEHALIESGVDINAYVNDNLIIAMNKLNTAFYYEQLDLVIKTMDAMWELYIVTVSYPFVDDQSNFNIPRTLALDSFRDTLVRHVMNIKGSRRETPYNAPFLNVIVCFAHSIFASRPYPIPAGMSPRVSLWHTYLTMWRLQEYY